MQMRAWSQAGDVYITHIKPGEELAIMSAIQNQALPHRIRLLKSGDVMPLGAKAAVVA